MWTKVSTIYLLIISFCFIAFPVSANRQLLFLNLNSDVGLAQNTVRGIYQDRKGFMWFGTENGLSRYDGYEFSNIYYDPGQVKGLSSQAVLAVVEDSDGILWFGTSRGLNRFDPHTERFTHYYSNNADGQAIGGDTVIALLEIDKELWVATTAGVSIINLSTGVSRNLSISGRIDREIWSIAEDEEGGVWLGAMDGGVWYASKGSKQWRSCWFSSNHKAYINSVRKIIIDGDTVWAGTKNGLVKLSRQTGKAEVIPLGQQWSLNVFDLVKHQNQLWVATFGQGLYVYDLLSQDVQHYEQNTYDPYSISSNYVLKFYIDRDSRIWLGTQGGGVSYDSLTRNTVYYRHVPGQKNGLLAQNANAVLELNQDELVFGTDAGISIYNRRTQLYRHHEIGRVINLYQSSLGQNWVAAEKGVYLLSDNNIERITGIDLTYVITLLQLDEDTLLVGTLYGLWLWDNKAQYLKEVKTQRSDKSHTKSSAVEYLFQRKNGEILVATQAGVYIYDSQGSAVVAGPKVFQEFNDKSVVYIFEDQKQHLWFATNSQGLFELDEHNILAYYQRAQGMPDNAVRGVASSRDIIWASTDRGIVSIKDGTVTRYSQRFLSGEFNSGGVYPMHDGNLLFAGVSGVVMFHPDDLRQSDSSPIVISDIKLFNESLRPGTEILPKAISYHPNIVLRHDQNLFSLDFSAFDYNRQGLRYAYRMSGFQEDWVQTDARNRRATFTGLEAGEYLFQVKAGLNNDWGEHTAEVQITVLPPWWKTMWAYLLYAFSAMMMIVLYVRMHTYRLKRRAALLEKEVEERTQETKEQSVTIERLLDKKNEMFANISHELRTPIALIAGPVDHLLNLVDGDEENKMLFLAQRNIKRLNVLVDQLLQLSRLYYMSDEEKSPQCLSVITEVISISFQNIGKLKNLNLQLSVEPNIWVEAMPNAMDSLIINLISNAFKYTDSGGNVYVELKKVGAEAHLKVEDTGVGIAKDQFDNIFERFTRLESVQSDGVGIGLALVKQLLELHKGSIQLESEEAVGSCFTIRLPCLQGQQQSNTKPVLSDSVSKQLHDIAAMYSPSSQISEKKSQADVEQISESGKARLLIIDDTQDMRIYLQSILSNNFSCLLASSGDEGLEVAFEHIPDLVLCDVMMPGIDGFGVLDKLRDDPRTCHIPILILTAKGDRESKIKGWDKLADDYIVKPFDEGELLARLQSVLELRKLQQQKRNKVLQTKGPNDEQLKESVSARDQKFLEKLHHIVQQNYTSSDLKLESLASQVYLSGRTLQYKTKALLGKSPKEYLREFRLMRAEEILKHENLNGDEIADRVGFSSREYFSKCFKEHTGKTLSEYKQAIKKVVFDP